MNSSELHYCRACKNTRNAIQTICETYSSNRYFFYILNAFLSLELNDSIFCISNIFSSYVCWHYLRWHMVAVSAFKHFVSRFYFVFLNYIISFVAGCMAEIVCKLQMMHFSSSVTFLSSFYWCAVTFMAMTMMSNIFTNTIISTVTFWRKLYTVWHRHAPYRFYPSLTGHMDTILTITCENATSIFPVCMNYYLHVLIDCIVCIKLNGKIFPIYDRNFRKKKPTVELVVPEQSDKSNRKKKLEKLLKIIIFRLVDLRWNYPMVKCKSSSSSNQTDWKLKWRYFKIYLYMYLMHINYFL